MPCCLFTWHTYGSWLPDRPQGYVHWKRGLSLPNLGLAACYKDQQKEATVPLSLQHQETTINEILVAATFQLFRVHSIAYEATHIHMLVSWKDTRLPKRIRNSDRHSLTQRLNRIESRDWFSRGGDIKHVKNQAHFDHLYIKYLPSHNGMKWDDKRGLFQ